MVFRQSSTPLRGGVASCSSVGFRNDWMFLCSVSKKYFVVSQQCVSAETWPTDTHHYWLSVIFVFVFVVVFVLVFFYVNWKLRHWHWSLLVCCLDNLFPSKRLNSIFSTRCEHPLASKSKGWVKKVPIHWQMVIVKVIEWSSGWNFRSKFFCGISLFLSLNSPWNLLECQMWRTSSISICINTNLYYVLFVFVFVRSDWPWNLLECQTWSTSSNSGSTPPRPQSRPPEVNQNYKKMHERI